MKPAPFKHMKPRSLDGILEGLALYGEEAKVLAGGQSLLPMMNFRLARPAVLVDVSGVPELAEVSAEDGFLRVGSVVRQRYAERSDLVARTCPLLPEALRHVGHVQIRNRGTVGGSVVHADPAAELPAVVAAIGAEVVIRRVGGERTVRGADFFVGPLSTVLQPDELVVAIRFPDCTSMRSAFLEVARRGGDFAIAGVAISAAWDPAARLLTKVGIAAMGVGGTPIKLDGVERLLDGAPLDEELIQEAGHAAEVAVDPPADVHADALSRKQILNVLVRRAIRRVAS